MAACRTLARLVWLDNTGDSLSEVADLHDHHASDEEIAALGRVALWL
jgi:hypothetical protein